MINEPLNILMFNMSPYSDWQDGIVNRNYYIYKCLEKDKRVNKIILVDFLPKKIKPGIKYYYKNLLFGQKNKAVIFGDLTSLAYKATDKAYVYSSIDLIWSSRQIIKELNRLITKLNISNNLIIWSYNPVYNDYIKKIPHDLFIFDTVDNWSEHQQYVKIFNKQKILNNYKIIAAKSDLIFTVSKNLLKLYEQYGRTDNIYWIANGVDYEKFANPKELAETELTNENRRIIGYLGTIESRLDFNLIKYIAQKNKDKLICMAGPIWKNAKKEIDVKLKNLSNIIFPGRIHTNQAASYIERFDICIIPHKINKFVSSMNPMKMYDYLACGKPVVSTEGAGIKEFADYVYISNDYEKFNELIQQAINEDSDELQKKRQLKAKEQDWNIRVKKMFDIIQQLEK